MGNMSTAMNLNNLIMKYKEVITDTIIVRPLSHLWGDPVLDQHLSLEETPYSMTTLNTYRARGRKFFSSILMFVRCKIKYVNANGKGVRPKTNMVSPNCLKNGVNPK